MKKRTFLTIPYCCILLAALPLIWPAVSPGLARATGQDGPSMTARGMTIMRALAAGDPDETFRNDDSFAAKFVPPETWDTVFPGIGADPREARRQLRNAREAAYLSNGARTRYIDALVASSIRTGVGQVVILSAGYDSRAYRYHKQAPWVRFFEIDLPARQADKIDRVRDIFGTVPAWVRYVPADLASQFLGEQLTKAGYDKNATTLFLWEPINLGLAEEAISRVLAFMAQSSGPGSVAIFNYLLCPVLDGDFRYVGARAISDWAASVGEPFTFGIEEGAIEAFLNKNGLALIADAGGEELMRSVGLSVDGATMGRFQDFIRTAYVRVPDKSEQMRLRGMLHPTVSPRPAPEASIVTIPPDIQAFLGALMNAYMNRDAEKLTLAHSQKYLNNGIESIGASASWSARFYDSTFQRIRSARIIVTGLEADGDIATLTGFIKSNIGLDLLPVDPMVIKKHDGRWQLYGNQK
jgi:methyltransferase (TIGR00027 family)